MADNLSANVESTQVALDAERLVGQLTNYMLPSAIAKAEFIQPELELSPALPSSKP